MIDPETVRRAELLMDVGRWEEIRDLLTGAGVPNEAGGRPALVLARAYLGLEAYPQCIGAVDRGLADLPGSEWGHRMRSVALRRAGSRQAALRAALEAVRCDPTLPMAYVNLAECYLATEQLDEAYAAAFRSCELDPEFADGRTTLARVATAQGRFDEAAALSTEALALDPIHSGAHNELGRARLGQGEAEQARVHFVASARLAPDGSGAANADVAARTIERKAREAQREQAAARRAGTPAQRRLSCLLNPFLALEALWLLVCQRDVPRDRRRHIQILWIGTVPQVRGRVAFTAIGWAVIVVSAFSIGIAGILAGAVLLLSAVHDTKMRSDP